MGDLQVCSPQPNGVLKEDRLYPPLPSSIVPDCWVTAEQTTQEIVRRIQPTLVSEHKRKEVIDYVQTLIRRRLRCEVFPYGSVPLKTYLPDGDIDLTALSSPDVEDALGCDVFTVLKEEEQNKAAEYELKDVQFIFAEVKLVKCLVQNIVVDISFNQLGGLCTLCFLEQVDRLVGKDHLFKRSIILIKAWCYYESRILGAHHGLISTYALETLVLYIFNLFHSSLNGPLAVLYRFLEYFSKFDWENYCISLNGPVCKSSLPDIEAEIPENGGDDLLLSEEFLRNCVDMFSVPSRALETNSRAFPQKHLNIIDPLKENNNLGRSVNRGNFYRICSAFKYGARKLGRILLSPRERIADELKKFFANTLESHGSKFSTDVQNYVLTSGAKGYGPSSLSSHPETCSEDKMVLESSNVDFGNTNISGMKDKLVSRIRNEPERCSMEVVSSQTLSETDCSTDGNAVSGYRLAGDANNLVTSTFLSSRITNDTSDCSPPSSDLGTSLSGKSHYAPHLYFSGSSTEDGKLENGNSENTAGFIFRLEPKENHSVASNTVHACSNHEGMTTNGSAISSPVANVSEDLSFDIREMDLAAISGSHEASKSLANLSGDYNSHIRSLLYGQCCHGYALSAPVLPSLPISPSQFRNKKLWDMCRRSLQVKRNFSSQRNTNGVVLGPPFFPVNHTTLSSAAFGLEEKQKPRGTGTYIPNTNCHPCKGRLSPGRGRNQSPGTESQLQRHTRNNGLATARPETNLFEEDSHELLRVQYPVLGCGKFGSTDLHQSHPSMSGSSHANGPSLPSERLEFGSLGHLPSGVPLPKRNSLPDSGTPGCAPSLLAPVVQSPRLVLGNNPERVAGESYHLKDEDFPPLSL